MVSTIEIFEALTLDHVERVPLPADYGSATWIEWRDGSWWITFAHYLGKGGIPGRRPEHTTLVRFDERWKPHEQWSFPPAVVERWDGFSSSGGTWDAEGRLWTTGHHAPELYVLQLPAVGRVLDLVAVVPVESQGQGIAIDRAERLLYAIQRSRREVLVSRLPAL